MQREVVKAESRFKEGQGNSQEVGGSDPPKAIILRPERWRGMEGRVAWLVGIAGAKALR